MKLNFLLMNCFGVPSSFTPKYLLWENFSLPARRLRNSCEMITAVKMLNTIPIINVRANPLTVVVPTS